MSKLGAFLESDHRQLTIEALLAEIEVEENAPTPGAIEAFCQQCGALGFCLYRQTWAPDDGLLTHCPALRTHYNGGAK